MKTDCSRRETLQLCGLGLTSLFMPLSLSNISFTSSMNQKSIPSSNEKLPIIGLGTWQTFDVGTSSEKRAVLFEVLRKMREKGGSVIDSSPMYGSSESVVGDLTQKTGFASDFFYATKVWTQGKEAGMQQIKSSMRKMGRDQMDLMQIHNLVDYKTHVKTLRALKDSGTIRYWGITHYLDSTHARLTNIIKADNPDFVQVNYSIRSRNAEKELLEAARKYGTAVLVNRPFEGGSLFRLTKNKPLPDWCSEYDINSWGQYFLKFIVSHPAITCAIPGTSKPHHAVDNMLAGHGKLPDEGIRKKMLMHIKSIG